METAHVVSLSDLKTLSFPLTEIFFMSTENHVNIKPATRNHKGFFIQPASYKLMSIDRSGWALICIDKAVCHYVDPDDLQLPNKSGTSEG